MIVHRIETRRRARYYSLGDLSSATDHWIVIHGYGQLASEFIQPFESIVTAGRGVVAPEALNRYYKDGGAAGPHATTPIGTTWMTREDRDAEISDYVDFLDAVAVQTRGVRKRLTVLGFSQGVATVARWLALGQTRAQRCVLWAGALPADVNLATLRDAVDHPIDLVVGERDEFAKWFDQDAIESRLSAASVSFSVHRFAGGHRLDRPTLAMLAGR